MVEVNKPTETEIIREAVVNAKHALGFVELDHMKRDEACKALRSLLARIDEANEARDKSRTLPPIEFKTDQFSVQAAVEGAVCVGLEIGFDTAVQACIPQLKTVKIDRGMTSWNAPVNPFRREGTTITENKDAVTPVDIETIRKLRDEKTHCLKCKHTIARDGACHSIGCTCTCNTAHTDASAFVADRVVDRECDCDPADKAKGIHFNECTAEQPWKKRASVKHSCDHGHAETHFVGTNCPRCNRPSALCVVLP